jgi:hypothetical protein
VSGEVVPPILSEIEVRRFADGIAMVEPQSYTLKLADSHEALRAENERLRETLAEIVDAWELPSVKRSAALVAAVAAARVVLARR